MVVKYDVDESLRGYYARLNDVGREELSTVCSEEITFIPSSFFNRFCLSSEF